MDSESVFSDRVRERDLDNFLVEELQASSAFRQWLLEHLGERIDWPTEGEVRLRKSPPRPDGRQTDIQLGCFDADDRLTACVLMESKVTAEFQPGQAEAYALETNRHRAALGDARACSVLIGPQAKLDSLAHQAHFDAAIAIETLIRVLLSRRIAGGLDPEIDARLAVRIELLEALCGKRTGSGWSANTIATKRDFIAQYRTLAELIVPHLRLNPSTSGPKSFTQIFSGLSVGPDFPTDVRVKLKHEFGSGVPRKYANLQFTGSARARLDLDRIRALVSGSPYHLRLTDRSLFVEMVTPGIEPTAEKFEIQRENIIKGLRAVDGLSHWFASHRSEIISAWIGVPEPHGTLKEDTISSAAPSRPRLEADLEKALRHLAFRSVTEFRYPPHDFVKMLDAGGGVATARALLAGKPSSGFRALYDRRGLSVTVEALVIEEPWRSSGLFTVEEIERAERRLKEYGYSRD